MFSYVEETEEGTVLYQVRTYRWCMCWAFFNASEVFELTGIPYLYRKALGVHKKPTFFEGLAAHRGFWSRKYVYPKGTRLSFSKPKMSDSEVAYWFSDRI